MPRLKSPALSPTTASPKVTLKAMLAVELKPLAWVMMGVGRTVSKTMLAEAAALGLVGEVPVAAPTRTLTCTEPWPVGATVTS